MKELSSFTAFIFARGGSKGIKNKNFIDLNGLPLIAHTIESIKNSQYVDKIVVSTDCDKIADISKSYGAEILIRPKELASDDSPEIYSWKHAVRSEYFDAEKGLFISLPATSPLRNIKNLDKAIEKFDSNKFDIMVSVCRSKSNPYLNQFVVSKENKLQPVIDSHDFYRRQDIPLVYDIAGNFYICSMKHVLKSEKVLDGKIGFYEITQREAVDIDEISDLKYAEFLLRDYD